MYVIVFIVKWSFLTAPEYTCKGPGLNKYDFCQHISLYGKVKTRILKN